jgi:hypothetical protein
VAQSSGHGMWFDNAALKSKRRGLLEEDLAKRRRKTKGDKKLAEIDYAVEKLICSSSWSACFNAGGAARRQVESCYFRDHRQIKVVAVEHRLSYILHQKYFLFRKAVFPRPRLLETTRPVSRQPKRDSRDQQESVRKGRRKKE